jgi:hypothetical protein
LSSTHICKPDGTIFWHPAQADRQISDEDARFGECPRSSQPGAGRSSGGRHASRPLSKSVQVVNGHAFLGAPARTIEGQFGALGGYAPLPPAGQATPGRRGVCSPSRWREGVRGRVDRAG